MIGVDTYFIIVSHVITSCLKTGNERIISVPNERKLTAFFRFPSWFKVMQLFPNIPATGITWTGWLVRLACSAQDVWLEISDYFFQASFFRTCFLTQPETTEHPFPGPSTSQFKAAQVEKFSFFVPQKAQMVEKRASFSTVAERPAEILFPLFSYV